MLSLPPSISGSASEIVMGVLARLGILSKFPSVPQSANYLLLTHANIEGPLLYNGVGAAYWVLPDMQAGVPGTMVGREVHLHNGSSAALDLVTFSGKQPFGRNSGVTRAQIAAGGGMGFVGNYDPVLSQYFWQPMEQNSVTLSGALGSPVLVPGPGGLSVTGNNATRTP